LPAAPVLRPDAIDIDRLANFLNGASRVTLFCGAGCAGAHDEVVEFARKLKAPIVHAFRGKEFIEYDNPYDVGMTGLVGFASGYAAMKDCDALLMLGTNFLMGHFIPNGQKSLKLTYGAEALGNRCSLQLGLLGTVKDTVEAVLPAIKEKTDSGHLKRALTHYKKARSELDALAESGPNSDIIHPQYVTRLVSELAADDAIFTCDVGTPIIWTARYLKINVKRRIVGSFNHGSMANAMLQAIGA
jgi:pyruvate dehydrogenase (quinone)